MPRISLRTLHRLSWLSLVFIGGIVVTGAAVRLSGSGLGCSDWPRCNSSHFVDVSTHHGRIEQVNRLFTGVVAVAVVLAMLGAQRLDHPVRRLRVLGAALVLGVVGQIVLGGIVVLTGLNPLANLGHFSLSMFLVASNVALIVESGDRVQHRLSYARRRMIDWFFFLTCVLLLAGMVVTGAGPHAGDEKAVRFDVAISSVARLHSIVAWLTVGMLLLIIQRARKSEEWDTWMESRTQTIMVLLIAQGGVGYWQYFTDVPAGLVAVHVALATLLFISVTKFWLECRSVVVSGT